MGYRWSLCMNDAVIFDIVAKKWLFFQKPVFILEALTLDEVVPKLRQAEAMVQEQGLYAVGFLGYEAACAFDRAFKVRHYDSCFPFLWFGLYEAAEPIELPAAPEQSVLPQLWQPSVSEAQYENAILQIKEEIRRGHTYQVNYTFRLKSPFQNDAWSLFLELVHAQDTSCAAYVDMGRFVVCSASPELFFRLTGQQLLSRPMKGTASRGLTQQQDLAQAKWLHHSEKNRAENIMIVDMIRNDLGRIADVGSVRVPKLFEVERYPTVWQMTSTVMANTAKPVSDIMAALFPCASITGAPKSRTMKIISELESSARRIYTGCVGFIGPKRQAQFNVAIRTALVDRGKGMAEYGVGSGIVWDSVGSEEYIECKVKARVLRQRRAQFNLLESLLWTPEDGYFLMPYHLKRLAASAEYFGFCIDIGLADQILQEKAGLLKIGADKGPHKVRLLAARDGAIQCEALSIVEHTVQSSPVRLKLASSAVDSSDLFLYHKTTCREVYDTARTACPDADDALLFNERGEITETTTANVVIKVDGQWVTPPVTCGLLAGTFRAWLVDQGQLAEGVVTIEMLRSCPEIGVINSVRKWRSACIIW